MKFKRLFSSIIMCLFLLGSTTVLATDVDFKIDKSNLEYVTRDELLDIIDTSPDSYEYNLEGKQISSEEVLNTDLTRYTIMVDEFNNIIYLGSEDLFKTEAQLKTELTFKIIGRVLIGIFLVIFIILAIIDIVVYKENLIDAILGSLIITFIIFVFLSFVFLICRELLT